MITNYAICTRASKSRTVMGKSPPANWTYILLKHSALRVAHVEVFAMQCVVLRSHILTFPCTAFCSCVSQQFCIACSFKVIGTLKQDVGVLSDKNVDLPDTTFLEPNHKVSTERPKSAIPLHFLFRQCLR